MAGEPQDRFQPPVSRDQSGVPAAPERGRPGHPAPLHPPRPAPGAQRGPDSVQEPLPGEVNRF